MNYHSFFRTRPLLCKQHPNDHIQQAGFSLVELLIALAIAATLVALAVPTYSSYIKGLKTDQAVHDIHLIELIIQRYYTSNFKNPDSLTELTGKYPAEDPWGNPYQYLNIATVKGKGKVRKDKKLNPINSDYDLYSMGEDGKSVSPLTAKASRDDIVRANNGGFVGLASDY
ncbi:MAG: prepilin-type N-terminal cleavage/methylation domain-containing protein [Candidatus Competibacteraceae bacterium]|jgi:general secretion pathway protein G|nr:prepilin-type N-terminal cleavage/methylation domain-containing protein [Candidatus Competibacteraceae bacterium]